MKRILFLSKSYPEPKEGYQRRVWEMDQVFSDWEKEYLPLPDLAKNLNNFLMFFQSCRKADFIYLHSLSSAAHLFYRMTSFLWSRKVIWDVHGLVPEELQFTGESEASDNFSGLEKTVAENCAYWISVTGSMKDYLIQKHPVLKSKMNFLIPSAQHLPPSEHREKKYDFLYAGGIQAWQNVELISEVLRSNPTKTMLVLSSDKDYISKILNSNGIEFRFEQGIAYANALSECKLGFLLRKDHILNECAFPTKLMDYMQQTVVPILLSSKLADVEKLGVQFISFEELKKNQLPDDLTLNQMAQKNLAIAKEIFQKKDLETSRLLESLH